MSNYTNEDFKPNYLLFRFDTNERLDNFRKKGYMYLKNLDYFIKLEKQTKEKGKGDFNEGRACLIDDVKIYDQNNNLLGISKSGNTLRRTNIFQPIYCMTAKNIYGNIEDLNFPNFKSIIKFNKKMIDDFCKYNDDPHVLMIHNVDEFLNRVASKLDSLGFGYKTSLVTYRDTSVTYETKNGIEFNGPFHKEEYFSYQDEFRILVKTSVDDHLDFSIGSIEDISTLIPVSTLINGLAVKLSNDN